MKRLTVSAIALAMGMGSAFAADLPSRKAPVIVPPPPLVWTGFYAGLNIGGGCENNNNNNQLGVFWDPNFGFANNFFAPGQGVIPNLFFLPVNNNNNGSNGGVVGGGQVGYNYQCNPSIVVGVEADFQGTSLSNNNNLLFFPSPFNRQFVPGRAFVNPSILVPLFANNWNNQGVSYFGTVRGRLGWLFTPTLLVCDTGGFAYGGSSGFFDNINPGWTAGGGVEWMFAPNWSAKVEYLYAQFNNNNNYNNGSGYGWGGGWNYNSWRQSVNIVRVA